MSYEDLKSLGESLAPLANYIQVIGAAISSGLFVFSVMRRQYNVQKVATEHMEQALLARGIELAQLKQDLTEERSRADQYDPAAWLQCFAKERKDGNEARAAEALRAGVSRTTLPLYEAYLELARHHVTLYLDQDEALQLLEAERLARIASLLNPLDRSALALAEEIDAIIHMHRIRRVPLDPKADEFARVDPSAYCGNLRSQAPGVINAFLQRALALREAGLYLIFELLAYRAWRIALRELPEAAPLTCDARSLLSG